MRRLLGTAVLLVLASLAIPTAAHADTSDFTFDSFDADYTLTRLDDRTAQLDVVETIVARFPQIDQNRGIIRAIPDTFDGVPLHTSVASVVDQNGTAVPYTTDRSNGFIQLALGTDDYVHGAVTYVISYTQQNVVRSFADTKSDEFYWDVNGTGWAQPFGSVSATVHVDPSLVATLSGNSACYSGAQGVNNQCPITGEGGEFTATAAELGPGETLTVSIGFAPDTFLTPEPTENLPLVPQPIPLGVDVLSGGIGVLSVAGLVGAIVARGRSRRGEAPKRFVVPQYSEPKDITILQSAQLMGRPQTAIPAALVRLAVRKNIRILAYAIVEDGEPYTLQYLGSQGANAEDLAIIEIIFGADPVAGESRGFGQSDQTMMTGLSDLSTRAKASLVSAGYEEPTPGRGIATLTVVFQVLLGIVAIIVLTVSAGTFLNVSALLWPTMIIGTGILVTTAILARRPLRPTDRGGEARDFLLGMQVYLTLAEQDRMRALQSPQGAERVDVGNNLEMVKLYEKLLPWAVLWGVEDQWMRELAVRVDALPQQPDWFVGANGFDALLFSSTINGFSSALTPPVTVSSGGWSGSGGGSFSGGSFGGGFSGGGGGGGGGGGR